MRRLEGAIAGLLLLAQCGQVNYDALPAGSFSGSLFVMWVGEGDGLGDGAFVFVPNPDRPLTFTRTAPGASVQVIRPGLMYTDGGSIPKAGQVFRGFSPWGYAPAYMVHDWLFTARHCLRDGTPRDGMEDLAGVDFPESAAVMGEAIRTLVQERRVAPNDVAGSTITSVVAGPISRAIWNREGVCAGQEVTKAHREEVERNFPNRARAALRQGLGVPDALGATPPGPKARVIAEVSF